MNLIEVQPGKLYVPEDFSKQHYYFADAEGKHKYTGITTILGVLAKPALIGWAARMAVEHIEKNCDKALAFDGSTLEDELSVPLSVLEAAKSAHTKKKEAAGAHGTDAHALVELYVNACLEGHKGRPLEIHKLNNAATTEASDLRHVAAFVEWALENVDHFLFSERRMAHPELFIAGTADFAYVDKQGRRMMADFKTSSGVYGIDFWLQTAAYRMLAEGEGDEPYDGMTVVRLGKKGPTDFDVHHLFDYETFKEAFLACLTIYRAQGAIKGLTVH